MANDETSPTPVVPPSMQTCLLHNERNWRPLSSDGSVDHVKDAEGNRAVLTERLGRLLLTQNLVVLVGSGASVAVGGPSMGSLWDAAYASQSSTFSEVCTSVKHDIKNKDIEALLSRCQAALTFEPEETPLISTFVKAVEEIIRHRCGKLETWKSALGEAQALSDLLTPLSSVLARVVPRRQDLPRTRIFTTNYDLCIELAAKARRMPFLDGFDLITPRAFDGRWFDYDFVRRSSREGAPDYLESVFHLYKLHGSVDWVRTPDEIIRDSTTLTPYLIFPRNEKFAQSYDQPFLEMMSRFQMVLREKDTALIAIGFGFNDHHLNQPIFHALATNPSFKLVIVDNVSEDKFGIGKAWDTLFRLQQSGAPVDVLQTDFRDFADLLPTYAQARASNTQEKAAQLLKVLSAKT